MFDDRVGSGGTRHKAPPHTTGEPRFSKLVTQDFSVPAPEGWRGQMGAELPVGTALTLRLTGQKNAPVVGVLGGISANHIIANGERGAGQEKGWWSQIVAADGGIDLNHFRVCGFDYVAGDDATPLTLTPADEACLFAYGLSQIGITALHALVGASFGGMVAQSFARLFPQRLEKLVLLCVAHRSAPMAQAWRLIQRQILQFSLDHGVPEQGVALARALAMTTYRTPQEFHTRFACVDGAKSGVEDYLRARGRAYAKECGAVRFLTLSAAIDRHFENPEVIKTPCLIIAADNDQIVPLEDVRDMARRFGGPLQLEIITSIYGHDAFLKETTSIKPLIRSFIS